MRPIVFASALLLVLSGCAAAETQSEPTEAVSAQVQNSDPEEANVESEETSEPEATSEPEESAEESEQESSDRVETSEAQEPRESEEAEGEREEEDEREEDDEREAEASPSPTATATQTQAPEPEVVGYTLAEVAQKNTSADCWVAIDGGVYDLTMWIRSHPGGAGAITQLCGKDGTSQFLGMHGGQARPASTLDGYYIGPLR